MAPVGTGFKPRPAAPQFMDERPLVIPSAFAATLRKILQVEARKGYDDSAVVGGLDRYLARTLPGAAIPEVVDFPIPRGGYAALDVTGRHAWADQAQEWIDRSLADEPPVRTVTVPASAVQPATELASKPSSRQTAGAPSPSLRPASRGRSQRSSASAGTSAAGGRSGSRGFRRPPAHRRSSRLR